MKRAPKVALSALSILHRGLENPLNLHAKIIAEYGDISYKRLDGHYNFYMGHPLYAKHILQEREENYLLKHPFTPLVLSPFLGDSSIFYNDDLERWYRDRLISKVHFDAKSYFPQYAVKLTAIADRVLQGWDDALENNSAVDISSLIDKLLVEIEMNTIFTHFDQITPAELAAVVPEIVELIKNKIQSIFSVVWFFNPKRVKYNQAIAYVQNAAKKIVEERDKSGKMWDDLLSHFIHEYPLEGERGAVQHIVNQVITFLVVGYFTTAALLHWLLVTLSLYPAVVEEIMDELDRVVGRRLPLYEDIEALPYLSAVIREVMRLHPSAHCILRQAIEEDEVNGFTIPAKAGITLCTSDIHRHPDFWENPDSFDPLRFIKNPMGQGERFAYIPFGAGRRSCVAAGFAVMEATLVVAMILPRFRFYLPPSSEVQAKMTSLVTNRPTVSTMIVKKVEHSIKSSFSRD